MSAPARLGAYQQLELLGRGGQGAVHRARSEAGDEVALKWCPFDGEGAAQRYRDEVAALRLMNHPCVVTVLDDGETPDGGWFTMPLGRPVSLPAGPLQADDWSVLRRFVRDVLQGLAHAHARGIHHLDLKPSNVLRIGPRWCLADFGLAGATGGGLEQAFGGPIGGSRAWMAPEQLAGQRTLLGRRADLYAVGCLTWAMATGRPPHVDRGAAFFEQARLNGAHEAFAPRGPVPAGLEPWLRWLLAGRPGARPESAAHALAGWESLGGPIPVGRGDLEGDTQTHRESDAPAVRWRAPLPEFPERWPVQPGLAGRDREARARLWTTVRRGLGAADEHPVVSLEAPWELCRALASQLHESIGLTVREVDADPRLVLVDSPSVILVGPEVSADRREQLLRSVAGTTPSPTLVVLRACESISAGPGDALGASRAPAPIVMVGPPDRLHALLEAANRAGDCETAVRVCCALGRAAVDRRAWESAAQWFAEAERKASGTEPLIGLAAVGTLVLAVARAEAPDPALERALEAWASTSGEPQLVLDALDGLLLSAALREEWTWARELTGRWLAWAAMVPEPCGFARVVERAGRAALRAGDGALAEAVLTQAAARWQRSGHPERADRLSPLLSGLRASGPVGWAPPRPLTLF